MDKGTTFTYHDRQTAPEDSQALMDESERSFGALPNLHRLMAEAPITYEAYLQTFDLFMTESSFSDLEKQIVFMTANVENRCHYCTAGHSGVMHWAKMPEDIIEALRNGEPISDPKLRALQAYTKALIDNRGHVGDAGLQAFLDAGYSKRQALEVLCGLAAKLISNFTNALTHTDLDDSIKPFVWVHPNERND